MFLNIFSKYIYKTWGFLGDHVTLFSNCKTSEFYYKDVCSLF